MANWLTEAIAKETAYEEGYEAGKQAAAEQIFEELEDEIKNHSIYWTFQNRANLLDRLNKFKEKYRVK